MAAKYFAVLACLALTQGALVKRETDLLQDLQQSAVEFQKTFPEQFKQLVDSKNTQEFTKTLKEGSDSIVTQLTSFSASLQTAIQDASGKAKEALEATRANVEKTTNELRAAHPDVEQQAAQLKDKFTSAVQNTVQDAQKLAKEVAAHAEQTNQKLAPTLKKAYDDLIKQVEDVQKKLHEAANKQ